MILAKKAPYANTTADPEKTESQINKLLKDYGIGKYQWSKDYDHNIVFLTFEIEAEINDVKKKFLVKVTPPAFLKQRMTWNPSLGHHDKVYAPNWAQSYRLLYYWLKVKLESIAYGLVSAEQEFLSQVVVPLKDGRTTTIGELVTDPEVFAKFALEEKPNVVDAQTLP